MRVDVLAEERPKWERAGVGRTSTSRSVGRPDTVGSGSSTVGRVLGAELTVFEFLVVLSAAGLVFGGVRLTSARLIRLVVRRVNADGRTSR
ncbi:hypothetical protein [Nocardia araoensis]|uniref:hypothetical protein n=1 Tax=Nocardia araoensis TaxID=228600 RepID=UPI0002FA142A|nr:hypothetical protein [Nocardia araoensis]